jgi:hypothetical protein
MTNENFLDLCCKGQPGDLNFFHRDIENCQPSHYVDGVWVQMTGEMCHVQILYQPIYDEVQKCQVDWWVISANGKIVAKEKLSENLAAVADPATLTLYLSRICDITPEGQKKITDYAASRLGTPYNMEIIKNIASKQALTEIPIIGFFINKNIWKEKSQDFPGTICSKEATLCVRVLQPDFLKDFDINSISPTRVWEAEGHEPVVKT